MISSKREAKPGHAATVSGSVVKWKTTASVKVNEKRWDYFSWNDNHDIGLLKNVSEKYIEWQNERNAFS